MRLLVTPGGHSLPCTMQCLGRRTFRHVNVSRRTMRFRPIVACNHGEGIAVSKGVAECIGNPLRIADGAVKRASDFSRVGLSTSQESGI
jgi:hypothetical protein